MELTRPSEVFVNFLKLNGMKQCGTAAFQTASASKSTSFLPGSFVN